MADSHPVIPSSKATWRQSTATLCPKGVALEIITTAMLRSFMNIGEAMGCAMVQLQLNSTQACSQLTSEVSESPSLSPSLKPTYVPTIIVSSESSSPQPSYTASEEPPEKDIV
mmetsp:Transcript_32435/g.48963  ORF Transcript_32435/g.48963 Transcript_32435/m.48963 type:complete len:113 (+) Transcript_32435:468-806(+)